jgi:hypothetical protein
MTLGVHAKIDLDCEILGPHSGTAEVLSLLACYVVSTDKYLTMFRRNIVPPSSGSSIMYSTLTSVSVYQAAWRNVSEDSNIIRLLLLLNVL